MKTAPPAYFAFTQDETIVVVDNGQSCGQTQSRAFAGFLGREKRVEHSVPNFPGNSRSVVRHGDDHIRSGPGFRVLAGKGFIHHQVFDLNGQFAAIGHGIARVEAEIQQPLLELRRTAGDGPEVHRTTELEFHGFGEGFLYDLFDFVDDMLGIDEDGLVVHAATEG